MSKYRGPTLYFYSSLTEDILKKGKKKKGKQISHKAWTPTNGVASLESVHRFRVACVHYIQHKK